MTRQTAETRIDLGLEDDVWIRGSLRKPKEGWIQTSKPQYGSKPQLVVDWDIGRPDGIKIRDWFTSSVKPEPGKQSNKLIRLLNVLAEQPSDTNLWWDPDTLEWGYDMTAGSPPYLALQEGMTLLFQGKNSKDAKGQPSYRITGYKAVAKAKTDRDVDGA